MLCGAVALSGCADPPAAAPAPSSSSTVASPAVPPGAPLPTPDALTGVLYRLADVNVPGTEKISVVEYATPEDAAALDQFGRALADNGYTPLNFEAADIRWADTSPGDATAMIVIKPSNPQVGSEFKFPMEFSPVDDTWQLTRQTANILLGIGDEADVPPAPPIPPPAPTPPR